MVGLEALRDMRAQHGGAEVEGRKVHLVIAGDGPARKQLEQFAQQHALPVTFVGNLKNDALPPLYRAADLFVTCSTSETYGVRAVARHTLGRPPTAARLQTPPTTGRATPAPTTCRAAPPSAAPPIATPPTAALPPPRCPLPRRPPPRCHRRAAHCRAAHRRVARAGLTVIEALSCGTPVVLPHCAVFDELWAGRIPDEWRYPIDSAKGPAVPVEGELPKAMRAASARASKERLQAEPITNSWADATDELLEQYKEAIKQNLPHRKELDTYTRGFTQFLRAALLALFMWWLVKEYAIEIGLVTSRLLGLTEERPMRAHSVPWAPLKPLFRVVGRALQKAGEE